MERAQFAVFAPGVKIGCYYSALRILTPKYMVTSETNVP
jgi:hypothetical protein